MKTLTRGTKVNPEFEEWVNEFVHGEEEMDTEFLVREAYRIGLRRGYDAMGGWYGTKSF